MTAIATSGRDVIALESSFSKYVIHKLAGGDGREVWNAEVPAPLVLVDLEGGKLVLDAAGNPIFTANGVVTAFDGRTGAVRWMTSGVVPAVVSVATDASGDVVVAGIAFTVAKLSGTTGAVTWHTVIEGTSDGPDGRGGFNFASQVAVDPFGDVVVVGRLDNLDSCQDFAIVKLAGKTGEQLRVLSIDGDAALPECYRRFSALQGPDVPADRDRGIAVGTGHRGAILAFGELAPTFGPFPTLVSIRMPAAH